MNPIATSKRPTKTLLLLLLSIVSTTSASPLFDPTNWSFLHTLKNAATDYDQPLAQVGKKAPLERAISHVHLHVLYTVLQSAGHHIITCHSDHCRYDM